ncbi:MAG: CHAT domain-containing protein [Saprospirales bacterium]|nr:CHAT domain-containing protein [Saprospirales bacterium]
MPWTKAEAGLLDAFTRFVRAPLREWKLEDIQSWAMNGQKLFGLLLPDWEAMPGPSSLVVIPDGKLDYLPFHLLLTDASSPGNFRDLPYLLKSCPVRYQFSSSLLMQPYKPMKKATVDYAGFAPVYQGTELIASCSREDSSRMAVLYPEIARDGLSKLEYNQPEVAEAATIWKSEGYKGMAATEHTFKEVGTKARILHLAMHALTNDREPLLSQLLFSGEEGEEEDGKLHNYELQNLSLSADLTVLSACNTGAGQLRRGEGVMSVSRAFRLAGCPNIVMSLWQANDHSTQEVVTRFFQDLKEGQGKATALQEASLHFLKTANERYTHPFYWGNMLLIGDEEPVEFSLIQRLRQLNRRLFK